MFFMNYFLNTYQVKNTLLFWVIILAPVIGLVNMFLLGRIAILIKLSRNMQVYLFIFSIAFIMISIFYIMPKLEDRLNHGVIKELFILDSDEKPLITLWFMRTHEYKFRPYLYDHRLETFELKNGKKIGIVEIQHRTESSNYQFYWSVGSKNIWGINGNKNAQLFSFTQPGLFKNTDNVPKFTENTREGWNERVANFSKRGWYEKDWSFRPAMGSLGQNLIGPGGKQNTSSTILLKPIFIEELNKSPGIKNKIWIFHKSAVHKNIEPLISYVDVNGKELNKINLNKIFNKFKVRPFAVFTREKEVMVFVTCGGIKKSQSDTPGFSLTALRFDRSTGRYLDRIDYIK